MSENTPELPPVQPPEMPRPIDRRSLEDRVYEIEASAEEAAALARRFALVAVKSLSARIELEPDGDAIHAEGRLIARIVQSCAISGDDLPVEIDVPVSFRFAPERAIDADEIELEEDECDEIPFTGHFFDLGEAVSQSLALSIDPYASGPNAEEVRKKAGLMDESASGPFAALAALKTDN
ncbi:YceD family protein [Altericroceibacterium endophyticum]|uniref:DUF177 domain-containing protein n=1 Tax=Altericroceibacterium endophyticum TaxID=1808508 RepID=A0A6I4T4W2_9SPHN|nr:DUF177 domain-containing protein [Altericroceibacterium endophyticum]MXO65936.1 DUF177 domain-containing protein [Altericroceibacterium endophyticum]